MIKTFKHKVLENFFKQGSRAGINPAHATKLENQLVTLNDATGPEMMKLPGWGLHSLNKSLKDHWSIKVNGNRCMTFMLRPIIRIAVWS